MQLDGAGLAVLDSLPAHTAVLDQDGTVVAANRAWTVFAAEHPDDPWRPAVGASFLEACGRAAEAGHDHATSVADAVQAVLAGRQRAFHIDVAERLPTGDFWFSLLLSPMSAEEGGAILSFTEITSRKRAETILAHQALHDSLTGLPNRTLFLDRLGLALARLPRRPTTVAVLFLDLDGFKGVNDHFGHDVGDQVLGRMAERLRGVLRPGDTAARLGGDEFTILCEDVGDAADAAAIADRVIAAVAKPFTFDDGEAYLTTSVGIALASAQGGATVPEALLRDADAAMYRAKELGKARWALFDERMRALEAERQETETALHGALERGELRVFYQPIVELTSGATVAEEALVRWEHPAHGLLAAAQWLSMAEDTGLIVPIGAWVVEQACRRAAASGLAVSVNLSRRQLVQPDLAALVGEAVDEAGLAPALLCVEVAETTRGHGSKAVTDTLDAIRAKGVLLAIDDAGTGWSSIGDLRLVDVLKLDRALVAGVGQSREGTQLVRAIVELGHALGLVVVAEGVETAGQLDELRRLGCDRAQGFHLGPPAP